MENKTTTEATEEEKRREQIRHELNELVSEAQELEDTVTTVSGDRVREHVEELRKIGDDIERPAKELRA